MSFNQTRITCYDITHKLSLHVKQNILGLASLLGYTQLQFFNVSSFVINGLSPCIHVIQSNQVWCKALQQTILSSAYPICLTNIQIATAQF